MAAYPARRHRAVIAGSRLRLDPQRDGEQVIGCAAVLPAQQEPVDVPLGQPHRPRVSAARRAGRAAGGMVSWAYAGMVISAFPASNRRPRLPRVLNDALDVTIVPPGRRAGYGRAMIVSAPSQLLSAVAAAAGNGRARWRGWLTDPAGAGACQEAGTEAVRRIRWSRGRGGRRERDGTTYGAVLAVGGDVADHRVDIFAFDV